MILTPGAVDVAELVAGRDRDIDVVEPGRGLADGRQLILSGGGAHRRDEGHDEHEAEATDDLECASNCGHGIPSLGISVVPVMRRRSAGHQEGAALGASVGGTRSSNVLAIASMSGVQPP